MLNLTAVFVQNAPIFASKPHFLDADPGYRDNVTGLVPDRSIHDSNLDIEPITGQLYIFILGILVREGLKPQVSCTSLS